ncbi:MAG: hypothetical protein H0V15_04390 [Solirubrobacterales bacterium]|nr:hypothetical protein [Solirubrobacterales bacterium]
MGAGSAFGATYTVDDFGDATSTPCLPDPNLASCNLRGAVMAARTFADEPVIKLLPGTYRLSLAGENGVDNNQHGDLDWTDDVFPASLSDLIIEGAGAGQTTIDATGLNTRILEFRDSVAVAIIGVTFKGGTAGTLSDGNDGGAIRAISDGPLFMRDVRFEGNQTLYTGGDGGAISTQKTNLTIDNASFVNNNSGDFGGAIAASTPFQGGANVEISNSTFDRNKAMGGGGGAIVNQGDPVSGELDSVVTITNSTFDGNTAVGFGGAIDSFGGGTTATNLISSTLTRNQANSDNTGAEASGALQNGGAAYTVKNSLIALNSVGAGGTNPNCSGFPFGSQGGNVLGDSTGCLGFVAAGDISGVNPLVGALSQNGGPTPTVPLLAGGPAVDHTSNCPATDQRGVARPQGAACDTGAFELVPPLSPAVAAAGPTPAAGPTGLRAAALKKCKKKKSKTKRKKCRKKANLLPL